MRSDGVKRILSLSIDFRVVRSDGDVYPTIWLDFIKKYAPMLCTRDFRVAPSTDILYESFVRQINLYHSDHWCDSYAQDRDFVTTALEQTNGMDELYNYCVYKNGRQLLANDNLCRNQIYIPKLFTHTSLWPQSEQFQTIVRNKCRRLENVQRCLVDSGSVERRLCGCFLPQSIVDKATALRQGFTDSNIRCWYPPCQTENTVKTEFMIDAVCPDLNIGICNIETNFNAGGNIINEAELLQKCGITQTVQD
jgi:hypothetical protein